MLVVAGVNPQGRSSSASTVPRRPRVTRADPARLQQDRRAHRPAAVHGPTSVNHNIENRNYYNFGCATQQNLAAMVANPLDLLYPRGMTPPDATRRVGVVGNYEGNPDQDRFRPRRTQGDYASEPTSSIAQGVG